ncbi:hypothetical protein [Niabella ginsengisoli]|uniref:Capsule assembly Wzi family protein n=1 Tax=Niabella ginsengisoli TaxID=522298 RepID=A0ABS9SGH4_9BACT|nr:hypothetical protein [Niabella ginsengisoli]MCH5597450.1 hypothetical protein [Niabella ginsengisoli]
MKTYIISLLLIGYSTISLAQHEHHQNAEKDTIKQAHHHEMPSMDTTKQHDHHEMQMSHAFSRNLPMTRNGSGTSWLPDNSPMYAYMFHSKKWMYMIHGNVFLRYNKQDLFNKGERGGQKFDAPNMVMLMGQRQVGKKGLFHFNSMFSLDPLTVGEAGYPLLFQTGETYKGQPLIDKQHPHDLISELSVSYAHAINKKSDVFLYLAYPGEPALGPAAFVHRPSGFFNPDAPLSHHWVDATHITFGVATLGYRYGNWKIEGSSFTGREPNENRYNFDKPRFDSWSGRLSFNPSPKWALQASHGFIKQPEILHLNEDVHRTTASAIYSLQNKNESYTNVTALWGLNKTKGHTGENAILVEGAHSFKKTTIYGRYEWVQKSSEELGLDEDVFDHNALFPVHALTTGTSYDLFKTGNTRIAVGGQLSIYVPDQKLAPLYGKSPIAGQIYLRIYPGTINSK